MIEENWQDTEKKFRKWIIKDKGQITSTIDGYIKRFLNDRIPKELIRLNEKESTFKSVFQVTNIGELEELSERFISGGDLRDFNINQRSNGDASAAISMYIKFLKKEIDKTDLTGITRGNILEAIEKYTTDPEICKSRTAKNYDLVYDNKVYPHKCIVGIAYNLSQGKDGVLDPSLYGSICEQKYCASRILKELGFVVINKSNNKIKIWKLAHSDLGKQYDIALKKNIATIGKNTKAKARSKKTQAENFKEASAGDYFFLLKNPNEIELIGRFVDNNIFDTSELHSDYFGRQYEKLFDAKTRKISLSGKWWASSDNSTFIEVPEKDYPELEENILLPNFGIYLKDLQLTYKKIKDENDEMENKVLNQILYGPPGTGKTYNTINKALEIIFNIEKKNQTQEQIEEKLLKEATLVIASNPDEIKLEKNKEDEPRKILKKVFEYFKDEKRGQIEFVTFHQSYGYEEFVEGIKAVLDTVNIEYTLGEGVFKRISKKAENNYLQSNGPVTRKRDFELVFQEKILDKLDSKLKIPTVRTHYYITDVNERTIYFEKADGQINHTLSIKSLKDMYDVGSYEKITGGLSVYYKPLLNLLLENEDTNEIKTVPLKNYILIIDEINRGNISKIFGELITLIEPSKRIGADEEIRLTLPNSKHPFGVPSNLYIIGTMNTADRSIAQIDTALRRRFVFEEMMPKPELLVDNANDPIIIKDTDIDVQKILEAINERIEYLYDREHTIGHSYFMDLLQDDCNTKAKLDEIFRVNIIPLLAEYFYGDWNDIKIILNDTEKDNYFITEKNMPTYVIAESRKNNKIYTVNQEGFSKEGYENIYITKADKTKVETNSL